MFADHQLDLRRLVHLLAAGLHAILGRKRLRGIHDLTGHRINRNRLFLLRGSDELIEIEGFLRMRGPAKCQRDAEAKCGGGPPPPALVAIIIASHDRHELTPHYFL